MNVKSYHIYQVQFQVIEVWTPNLSHPWMMLAKWNFFELLGVYLQLCGSEVNRYFVMQECGKHLGLSRLEIIREVDHVEEIVF